MSKSIFFDFSVCLKFFVIKYKTPVPGMREITGSKDAKNRQNRTQLSQENNPAECNPGVMRVNWKSFREIHKTTEIMQQNLGVFASLYIYGL